MCCTASSSSSSSSTGCSRLCWLLSGLCVIWIYWQWDSRDIMCVCISPTLYKLFSAPCGAQHSARRQQYCLPDDLLLLSPLCLADRSIRYHSSRIAAMLTFSHHTLVPGWYLVVYDKLLSALHEVLCTAAAAVLFVWCVAGCWLLLQLPSSLCLPDRRICMLLRLHARLPRDP